VTLVPLATPAPQPSGNTDSVPSEGLTALLSVLDLAAQPQLLTPRETWWKGDSVTAPMGTRVYGGQVLAQTLMACGRTVAPERPPHSLHGYFLRQGTTTKPIYFAVEALHDGNSFSARRCHAFQDGAPILSATASFQLVQPGYDAQRPMPQNVPSPESGVSASELLADHHIAATRWWSESSPFVLVPVGAPLYLEPDPQPTDRQLVWLRTRGPVASDSQLLHRALLAFACDQLLLEPALRGAGKSWLDVSAGIPIASLDHAMWWHRDVKVDDWLLFVQEAASSQGGRSLGLARVYQRDGTLVASIAQEGMLRIPDQ